MDQDRLEFLKGKYPSVPEYALPTKKGKKKSPANALTSDIMQYMETIGGYAIRINSQGTYSEALGKYIYSGSTKGTSDLIIVYKGLFIAAEIKIGKDKMSDKQMKFQSMVTQAGGHYFTCGSMDTFKIQFNNITKSI